MTTPLEKTLKRELKINGRDFIVAISPAGLKLTLKGRRKGLELQWDALVSGQAALAVALNASVGEFVAESPIVKKAAVKPRLLPSVARRGRTAARRPSRER